MATRFAFLLSVQPNAPFELLAFDTHPHVNFGIYQFVKRREGRGNQNLGDLGPKAIVAIPILVQVSKEKGFPRQRAAEALGRIGSSEDRVVSALIDSLTDPVSVIRATAIRALRAMGVRARVAVPALVTLHHDNKMDRVLILDALKRIDPMHVQVQRASIESLGDPDAAVRRAAEDVLAEFTK